MSPEGPDLAVKLWGDFACFTRPEMKVERVSYAAPTPSAVRGALEAIFWKPQISWRVTEIHVLNPIRYFSILRNEVSSRQSMQSATRWQREGGGYDATADRTQRHTLALRDVAYVVKAQIVVHHGVDADVAKYRDQFRRRVRQGRAFSTPYLGCREFAANFAEPSEDDIPLPGLTDDLGLMLLDIDYTPGGQGRGIPRFFRARVEDGVMRVPDRLAEAS
jgi:CRISPR-associated protein Cas5d